MERLSKNFIWLAAGNVAASVFQIAIFIYLARTLEPEAFGYLSYALVIVFYLFNFVDLGLSTYGVREIAKDKNRASVYVSEIVSFKLLAAAALYIIFTALIFLLPHSNIMKLLMAESCLLLFTSALATEWAFQGMEKMHMVFISLLVNSGAQAALVFTYVNGPKDLFNAPLAYLLAPVPVIFIFLRQLKFKLMLKGLDLARIKTYLSSSIILWWISIFAQVYNNLDVFLLGLLRPPEEVGYFTIARRIAAGVIFLVVFLANALLPRLSCTFENDIGQFNRATKRFIKLAVSLIIFLFIPMVLFGKALISATVGDEYLPAAMPLNIMMAGIALVALNLPYSTGLIAACFEKEVLRQVAACAFFSVLLNLILIPRFGMAGAAVSFFLAEALALVWILAIYRKKIGIFQRIGYSIR